MSIVNAAVTTPSDADTPLTTLRKYIFASVTIGATDRHRMLTFIDALDATRAASPGLREAAQQAMEVLIRLQLHGVTEHREQVDAAYETLRTALSEPA